MNFPILNGIIRYKMQKKACFLNPSTKSKKPWNVEISRLSMVPQRRFEHPTHGLGNRRSIPWATEACKLVIIISLSDEKFKWFPKGTTRTPSSRSAPAERHSASRVWARAVEADLTIEEILIHCMQLQRKPALLQCRRTPGTVTACNRRGIIWIISFLEFSSYIII